MMGVVLFDVFDFSFSLSLLFSPLFLILSTTTGAVSALRHKVLESVLGIQ
jgi:hypothetical protein